ncbi:CatA-like O-acetyltransferase [Ferrimonas pelagia]|uniref:CatA-like O-acetyltransferase n=1 Tax=Ferrimonas pelagia TaxID=1177826 RepID=A0ABP9EL90_9GAMM
MHNVTTPLEMATFPRRQQFEFYGAMELPNTTLCADVTVTALLAYCQQHQISSYRAVAYAMLSVAQQLPWMRWRIRDEGRTVVEHSVLSAGATMLGKDEQVRFTCTPFQPEFRAFDAAFKRHTQQAASSDTLFNQGTTNDDTDAFLYLTCLPWLRFTQFSNPMPIDRFDAVPRLAWGKYDVQGAETVMPVALQAHHGLADGLHLTQFYHALERMLAQPDQWLSPAQ